MQIKPVLGAMGAMRLRNPRPHREKSRSPLRWGLGSRPPVGEVRSGSNGDLADPAGVSPLLPPKPDISALATYVSNGQILLQKSAAPMGCGLFCLMATGFDPPT